MARTRKNPRVYLFALMAVLLASCAAPSRGNLPDIEGMNYHDARKVILQNGWVPADGMRPDEEIGIVARNYRDLGYAEVDDCAGSGLSPCIFYFRNDEGRFLKIGTEGEDNGRRMYPRVVYAAIHKSIDE